MSDRPGDAGPPIEKELALPRWIMLVVVFLGIVTIALVGTAVAISTTGGPDQPGEAATTPTAERTTATPTPSPSPTADTPLANLECDGRYIVELGRSRPPFAKSSVETLVSRTEGAKYLQANRSCETYSNAGNRLVAYLGPFDDLPDACAQRVQSGVETAVAHRMDAQQVGHNYCACEVDPPVLRVNDGKNGDRATLLAVREAQQMLKVLGHFEPAVSGTPYGPQTQAAVQRFQAEAGLRVTGVLNRATWTALRRSTAPAGRPLC